MSTPSGTGEVSYSLMAATTDSIPNPITLQPPKEYILGRSKSADFPVADEKASRRHARLFFGNASLCVEDLASANGTKLNGITLAGVTALKDGDVIEIGKARYQVGITLAVSEAAQTWWRTKKEVLEAASAPQHTGNTGQWMSGTLKSVSLVELLQLLSTSQKSAQLTLKRKDAKGQLFLRDGQVISATLNGRVSPQPVKNVFRLLQWQEGRFELTPLEKLPSGPEIDLPTSALLLEGLQLADEMSGLASDLPGDTTTVHLTKPCPVKLRELAPEELDLVQLALEHDTWLDVLDHYEGTDLDAAKLAIALKARNILTFD